MEINDKNFKTEVEDNKNLVLVDFYAPWCGPCKMMGPIIEELSKDYDDKIIKIVKLNIDENRESAEKYNVMSIPTLILYKEGKIIEQMVGLQSKEAIKELIEKYL